MTGDAEDLAAVRWVWSAHTPADVGGHDAWYGQHSLEATQAAANQRSDGSAPAISAEPGGAVMWQEAPGVIVAVQGYGLSEDELLAAAESLRPATDAEWSAALAEARAEAPG